MLYTKLRSLQLLPEERAEFILQLGLPYPLEPAEAQDILRRHEAPDKLLQALDDERLRCQELMRQQGDLFKAVAAIETYRVRVERGRNEM